ncbi:hypothetical protein FC96_GL000896 [Secundilactobacillus kimchicus JCM 15530]|uniref:Uncharacterized protein n=1 Tax=Secundilactobacillus kimchicus JCM 15530 TaxID=1302272 RepID=A0A0R1HVW6_9LACO|nr:hypothetical protein FC96_GL000896 [Secundilactobacillus kimchicus JCM 15530]
MLYKLKEWSMVMQQAMLFDQLDEEAQRRAVQSFLQFYLNRFRTNSLEILSAYPVQYEMEQVNHDVVLNQSRQPEELVDQLVAHDRSLVSRIISALNQGFMSNGALSDGTWESWYEAQHDQLASGL